MTGSREPKPGQVLKRLGPHDLVTPVPRFENRVFHLVLGPGQRSEVKRNQFWTVIFMKTRVCED